MATADFLVIGGGIAGLSAAARLAAHGRVVVLEAEEGVGYHSSGRSATFAHYGIGDRTVRGLTSYSRTFFQDPTDGFAGAPLAQTTPALFIAREEMVPELDALQAEMQLFTDTTHRADEAEMLSLCPVLKTGEGAVVAGVVDAGGLRLDSDALLQGYARAVKTGGGETLTRRRIAEVARSGAGWDVTTETGERWSAPVVINAAGAWADAIAAKAGVVPLGLQPKRRTIIVVDGPEGKDVRGWPFVKTVANEFYMLPESGRLMASPIDEIDCEPCDAQPDDYDIALAAHRVEEYTTLPVQRIAHRWAGLRTFTPDRVPTAGFAPDAPGFFWLAGQGGYGLQTAPAMAEASEALILGTAWPQGLSALGVDQAQIRPERLLQS